MWRLSLGRRLLLVIFGVVMAALWSFVEMGPMPKDGFNEVQTPGDIAAPVVKRNLLKHLYVRFGLSVEDSNLHFQWAPSSVFDVGKPGVVWFSAAAGEGSPRDVYFSQFRVSQAGIPIGMAAPVNVTRTPVGDEHVLDVGLTRVLYSVPQGGSIDRVVELDFAAPETSTNFIDALTVGFAGWLEFGHWGGCSRRDVVFTQRVANVAGRLEPGRVRIEADGEEIVVDLRDGAVSPSGSARLVLDSQMNTRTRQALNTVFEASSLIGVERFVKLVAFAQGMVNWFQGNSAARLPASNSAMVTVAPRPRLMWPPPDLPGFDADGQPGVKRWRSPEGFAPESALMLTTEVLINAGAKQQSIHLYAFDMRRLGLGYVAGTHEPRSKSGVRGNGRMPHERRQQLVAVMNGGLRSAFDAGGRIVDGRVIVPPEIGRATLALQRDGQPAFGLWDAEQLDEPWVSLIQNQAPLVMGGRSLPRANNGWGQLLADFDEQLIPRTGLGVTEGGVVMFAWSPSVSALGLAEALRLAGAEFAMHLAVGLDAGGLAMIDPNSMVPGSEIVPDPRMAPAVASWLATSPDEFFYLFRTGRLLQFLATQRNRPDALDWTVLQYVENVPFVATARYRGVSDKGRETKGSAVTLYAVSAEQARPHLLPGLAEERPVITDSRTQFDWPGGPLFSIGVGLRPRAQKLGLTVERRVWSSAQKGVFTMVVDADGELSIGRYGDAPLDADVRWSVLLQGSPLVENGLIAEGASGIAGRPLVGLGQTGEGCLVFAVSQIGNRAAIASALKSVGARAALLLGDVGTARTGVARFYEEGQSEDGTREFYVREGGTPLLKRADFAQSAGSTIYLTARKPKPSARAISTFLRIKLTRD